MPQRLGRAVGFFREVMHCDLASTSSVRNFARTFQSLYPCLDAAGPKLAEPGLLFQLLLLLLLLLLVVVVVVVMLLLLLVSNHRARRWSAMRRSTSPTPTSLECSSRACSPAAALG